MAEARVNVNVNVGGNASAQLKGMAQEAEKAHKAMNAGGARSTSAQRAAAGSRPAGSSGGTGGAAGLGGAKGAGPAVAAAVMVAGISKALDKVTKGLEIAGDSYATSAQRARALGAEFIPFADKLMKLQDAVNGVTDKMNRQAEAYQVMHAQDAVGFDYRRKIAGAAFEQSGLQAQVRANAAIGMGGTNIYDRGTLAGERASERQDMTQGAKDELVRAQREAMATAETSAFAKSQVSEADKKVAAQMAATAAADAALKANTDAENGKAPGRKVRGTDWSTPASAIRTTDWSRPSATFTSLTGGGVDSAPGGTRDKAGRDEAGRRVMLESTRLSRELESREQAIVRAKEAGAKAVEAESRARQASINLAKAELNVLQQQEQRMKSLATGVGAMSQGERIASVNALRAYQANGGEAPPEIEALVSKLAPDLVRKNQERRGAGFIEGDVRGALGEDGFKDAFGGDFGPGSTLKEVMAKVDKVKADIRVEIDIDATSTAKQLAELLAPVLENLQAAFKVELMNVERRIKAGTIIARSAAGP